MKTNIASIRRSARRVFSSALLVLSLASVAHAQTPPRARDLGVPFDGTPGSLDAITDVKGVEVGDTTLISGDGPLKVGVGPVRTGVTVIFPRGKENPDPVYAGWFAQNGNGEMTGHNMGRRIGLSRNTDRDHQHTQRRRCPRRNNRLGAETQFAFG